MACTPRVSEILSCRGEQQIVQSDGDWSQEPSVVVELHGFRFITHPKFFMFLAHQRAHVFEYAQPKQASAAAASSGPASGGMAPQLVPRPVLQQSVSLEG
jgi:hypothetical protein